MSDSSQVQSDLVEQARALLAQLEGGNAAEAMQTISNLHHARDIWLYEEVGKLTRSVHTAIKNLAMDANVDSQSASEMSRIADASDRLNYVITKTEQAANKTMDLVEETIPVSADLGDKARALKEDWQKLMRKEMKPEEFRALTKEMDQFLDFASAKTSEIDSRLSGILLAQDYQDLTGQVIKRVIALVQDVEDNLVELVKMAGTIDHIAGFKHEAEPNEQMVSEPSGPDIVAEGPIVDADNRDDVVSGQDEVDDLLSSLGF